MESLTRMATSFCPGCKKDTPDVAAARGWGAPDCAICGWVKASAPAYPQGGYCGNCHYRTNDKVGNGKIACARCGWPK